MDIHVEHIAICGKWFARFIRLNSIVPHVQSNGLQFITKLRPFFPFQSHCLLSGALELPSNDLASRSQQNELKKALDWIKCISQAPIGSFITGEGSSRMPHIQLQNILIWLGGSMYWEEKYWGKGVIKHWTFIRQFAGVVVFDCFDLPLRFRRFAFSSQSFLIFK